jgi:hypothetical protein
MEIKRLLEWASGTIFSGKNSDPRRKLESLDRWSGRATLAILLGIAGEIALILIFPHEGVSWTEKGFLIAFDAAIVIGLAIEYICIRQTIIASGELQRQADEKLSEALDRAARSEEELARLRTQRKKMIAGYESSVTEKLKAFKNVVFDAALGPNDKEVEDFLWDLEPILWHAGWQQIDWLSAPGVTGVPRGVSGRRLIGHGAASNVSVQIFDPAQSPLLVDAGNALVSALREIGIDAQIDGFNIYNATPNAMHILVGPKR